VADLILLTGPPGAGKSTVARELVARFEPSVLVSGDAFFGFIARGAITPWEPEATHQNETCTSAAGAACGQYARSGYTVVFDGMVGPWFLPTFLTSTGLSRLAYAVLMPPADVCVQRVRSRVGHGFGDVPATRHMHAEFERAAPGERHLISAVDECDRTVDAILDRLRAGSLHVENVQ
jgi:predicted ABC-type ATPase